jgi:hypothetical protein
MSNPIRGREACGRIETERLNILHYDTEGGGLVNLPWAHGDGAIYPGVFEEGMELDRNNG